MRAKHQWEVDWPEAVWATTAPDAAGGEVTVSGKRIARRERAIGFRALGVTVTFDSSVMVELAERTTRAW